MHNNYRDILDRIAEAPSWFDDAAVPRYEPFAPTDLANIYADEAALAEVSCQNCGRLFRVALTGAFADRGFSLSDSIRLGRVSYGDPPNVGCCDAGPAMTSDMRSVLEYWARNREVDFGWRRDPMQEGPVPEGWIDPPDTVSDVNAALAAGATKVLVICTSTQNRYDLAGRVAAVLVGDLVAAGAGRLNVVHPLGYVMVANGMLKGHVAETDVGSVRDGRRIVLVELAQARTAEFTPDDAFVILSGPALRDYPDGLPPKIAEREEVWAAMAGRLDDELAGHRRVEFALAHSRPMLAYPDAIIDAGRASDPPV